MGIDRAGNDNPSDAASGAEHEMVIRIRTLRPWRSTEVLLKRRGERRKWTAVEDAEAGDFTRFQLWDKADWNGSKKHRRCFCGSSSAGSLLPRKLQRLSLQDRTPAAAAVVSSSSAMAQHRGEGIVEVAHQVEEAAPGCIHSSASKKQTISSQKTLRRARSFRPRQSSEVMLRGWLGERREWTAEEDEKLRNAFERFKGDWLKIGEHFKERGISEAMNRWHCVLYPYIKEGPQTEEVDKVLSEWANQIGPRNSIAIEGRILGRTKGKCEKRCIDLKNSMNTKSRTKDAESGNLTRRFGLRDKADCSGSKGYRGRRSRGSSSVGSLLRQKLQCLSIQDRAPPAAAAALSSPAMAQDSEGVVNVEKQVEEAASARSPTS